MSRKHRAHWRVRIFIQKNSHCESNAAAIWTSSNGCRNRLARQRTLFKTGPVLLWQSIFHFKIVSQSGAASEIFKTFKTFKQFVDRQVSRRTSHLRMTENCSCSASHVAVCEVHAMIIIMNYNSPTDSACFAVFACSLAALPGSCNIALRNARQRLVSEQYGNANATDIAKQRIIQSE